MKVLTNTWSKAIIIVESIRFWGRDPEVGIVIPSDKEAKSNFSEWDGY